MNLFSLNSSALNGSPVSVIQASAAFSCSAGFSAEGTRVVTTQVNISASAAVIAGAIQIHATDVALIGHGMVRATPKHYQAGSAGFVCGSSITAYVLRTVQGDAVFACNAMFSAIPASLLGSASFAASANLTAEATQVRQGSFSASCNAAVTAAPYVIRNAAANIDAIASVRSEPQQNNAIDGHGDFGCTAQISVPNTGIMLRKGSVAFDAPAGFSSAPAIITQGGAQLACTAEMLLSPQIVALTGAYFRWGTASVIAGGVRVVLPEAAITAFAQVQAGSTQTHAAEGSLECSAQVVALSTRTVDGGAVLQGTASIPDVAATVARMADVAISGNADMVVTAALNQAAASVVGSSAELFATATVLRMAQADPTGNCSVAAAGMRAVMAEVQIGAGAEIVAFPVAVRMAQVSASASATVLANSRIHAIGAANISGTAEVTADIRSNAESFDPPERTLRRPYTERTMYRPYTERTIRRAA